MKRASIFHVLGIVLAAGLVAGCSASNPAKSEATAPAAPSSAASLAVTVEPVQAESMGETITATGSVMALQQLVVSAETNGVAIAEVAVDEGAVVKKGDLLARLNDSMLVA